MIEYDVPELDPDFEALLEYIQRNRSFDFTGYKRSSLIRRFLKRMQIIAVEGDLSYIDFLEVHPEEFRLLFDTILINSTSFFRDTAAWDVLSSEILPRILAGKHAEDPIRIWCAGCASGEETYGLAMILAEALGSADFRNRVKIYATDVDDEALAKARQAQYNDREILGVPTNLLTKYFEPVQDQRYTFQKDLRRSMIFGRHDLIQDAPISRIDLLCCRNTLMYFNSETQTRILDRFYYALADRGFLFLGKAETSLTYNNMFVPVDLKRRIFAKVSKGLSFRDRQTALTRANGDELATQLVSHVRLRESAFESSSVSQLVVDFGGLLALANEKVRTMFHIEPGDLGRPFQDLQLSYRPADLRSCIDRVYQERKAARLAEVEWSPKPGEVGYLDIHVVPLFDPDRVPIGTCVTFVDATVNRQLQEALQTSHRELEIAYEELQSTNEELETMNEELQSTNEEIEAINDELGLRGKERDKLNGVLQSILRGDRIGLVARPACRRDQPQRRSSHRPPQPVENPGRRHP